MSPCKIQVMYSLIALPPVAMMSPVIRANETSFVERTVALAPTMQRRESA